MSLTTGCAGTADDADSLQDELVGVWDVTSLGLSGYTTSTLPNEYQSATFTIRPTLAGTLDFASRDENIVVGTSVELLSEDTFKIRAPGYNGMDMDCRLAGDLIDCFDNEETDWVGLDNDSYFHSMALQRQ